MKRIVTFSVESDGRKRVQSISAPIDETKIDNLSGNKGFIDAGYRDPNPIEGKKLTLYYNSDTNLIEVDYSDIQFEDLEPLEQIKVLREKNEQLEADNLILQDAVMEMYELILGGEV